MNILLIEDSEILAACFIRVLRRKGHNVVHSPSIAVAEALLTGPWPDVVLTDRDVTDGNAWAWAMKPDGIVARLGIRVVFMSGRVPDSIPPNFYYKAQADMGSLLQLVEGGTHQ